ncbi:hypothetical protein [Blastococcus saxobsidens]|uniref:hypothetical protein n=1 Tax=Blastococcus saxobsidens TaxID=138336 RepID=UPI0019538AE8|nr:hypothetical protein [Blastococcus saxobsidens]
MTELDEEGPAPSAGGGRRVATLLGFLDHHRATLEWKTRGPDADGLRATVGAPRR